MQMKESGSLVAFALLNPLLCSRVRGLSFRLHFVVLLWCNVQSSRGSRMYGIGLPLFSPNKSLIDWESGIELSLAYSALYHNSFIFSAVHERWHGTSVGGGRVWHPSERSDQSNSSWSDPNGSCWMNWSIVVCPISSFLPTWTRLPLTTPEI